MSGLIACVCCYCCLTALKPRCIEILALICGIMEIGFIIWGVIDIPWNDISIAGKIIFFISCTIIFLSFVILLILMYLRCNNKINTTKNGTGKCLCIIMIILLILAEILIIIDEIIILFNMDDKDDFYSYYDLNNNRRNRRYSNRRWASAVISLTFVEISLGFHIYCASFLIKLIYAKTNMSYLDYIESKKDNSIFSKSINIFNYAHNNQNINQLNFLGYDKNGNPIFIIGNNQNFEQKQQNVNIHTNNTINTISNPENIK